MTSEHHPSGRMPVVQLVRVGSPLPRSQRLEQLRILVVDAHDDGPQSMAARRFLQGAKVSEENET
jgi:hypothetical protein